MYRLMVFLLIRSFLVGGREDGILRRHHSYTQPHRFSGAPPPSRGFLVPGLFSPRAVPWAESATPGWPGLTRSRSLILALSLNSSWAPPAANGASRRRKRA